MGGYDPDCRRCMDWSRTGENGDCADIYSLLRQLADLRENQQLAEGKIKIYAQSDVFILQNFTDKRDIVLLINNTDKKQRVAFGEIEAHSFNISVNGGVVIHG